MWKEVIQLSIFKNPIHSEQKKARIEILNNEIEEKKEEVSKIQEEIKKDYQEFSETLITYAHKLKGKWYEEQNWPDALLRRKQTNGFKCMMYFPLFCIKKDEKLGEIENNHDHAMIMLADNKNLNETEKTLLRDQFIIKIDDKFKDNGGRLINLSESVLLIYAYFHSYDPKGDAALGLTKLVLEEQLDIKYNSAKEDTIKFLYQKYHDKTPEN